jgi:hypothetical protein
MEGIMEVVSIACDTFDARGTPEYETLLARLPEEYTRTCLAMHLR